MSTTFHAALESACGTWGDRTAISWRDGSMTYRELRARIAALARAYRRAGIQRGDRVICQVGNRPEHLIALGAAWAVAAVHVGVDPELTGRELGWMLEHTGAAAILYRVSEPMRDARVLRDLHERRPETHVFVLDDHEALIAPEFMDLREAMAVSSDGDEADQTSGAPSPDDTAMLLFTSGTTGTPKGSIADHGSFAEGWLEMAGMLDFGPHDVHLVHLPVAHAFGLSMATMALMTGGRVILEESFVSVRMLECIAEQRVTVISGAPAHYILLLRDLDPSVHQVASLRAGVGSASTFTPALLAELFERLHIDFLLMYGSSEGVGIVTTDRDDVLRGSVGRPLPNEVRIVNADGTQVADGEIGEIAFNRTIAPVHHWGEPPPVPGVGYAGSRAGDGGIWYYSGDRGRIDETGRLFLLGRIKHLIDRGGLKVDPVEIAAAVMRCAGVADAAVIGTTNPVLGENICACVVVDGGKSVTLAELRAELAADLAPHKLPDELCIIDAVPRTALGKVDVDAMRALVESAQHRESIRAR